MIPVNQKSSTLNKNAPPFPLRKVILALLLPTLMGTFFSLFIAPPVINSDPASGMMAWFNFTAGGTWNAISTPDINNIAESTEYAVTWWAPGQYIPLGLLHSAGLTLGTGIAVVSALGTVMFGLGFAVLGYVFGLHTRLLPWLTLVACCTRYMLYPFGHFIGGEVAQMALWPWILCVAWILRKRKGPLIAALSPLLVLGAFAKHSFAIYALALLTLLWIEGLRELRGQGRSLISFKLLWEASYPIITIGILFIIGRHFLIDTSYTPGSAGTISRSFTESFGYPFWGPILSLFEADKTLAYISFQFFGIKGEDLWSQLGSILLLTSPIPLLLYSWLSIRRSNLDRTTGIVALVVGSVLFILYWRGGSISLDSRHYQPITILLLMIMGSKVTVPNRMIALGSRLVLIGIVLFGFGSLINRHLNMRPPQKDIFPSIDENLTINIPLSMQRELKGIVAQEGSVLVLSNEMLGCVLNTSRHPETRFFFLREEEFVQPLPHLGRVHRIAFISRPSGKQNSAWAQRFRESFKDYSADEWTSYEVEEGWVIWQAGDPMPLGQAPTEQS